ncbi:hypothetical protein K438DRAFT_1014899 [Mycena galopus ATCC 62051]|nr:hypothetical protein K438DRAFT_1014899 [Mycena galopus ATCC 62051]
MPLHSPSERVRELASRALDVDPKKRDPPARRRLRVSAFLSTFIIDPTAIQARYTSFSLRSSEEFSSASLSVEPGLIAAGIVSVMDSGGKPGASA